MKALANWLFDPRNVRRVGKVLWPLGWLLFTFGVFGQIGTAAEAVRRDGRSMILADLYPHLPTAWVPEGWIGFGSAATLVLSGWLCNRRTRSMIRVQR